MLFTLRVKKFSPQNRDCECAKLSAHRTELFQFKQNLRWIKMPLLASFDQLEWNALINLDLFL